MEFPSNLVKYYQGVGKPRSLRLYFTLGTLLLVPAALAQCPPALHPYTVQGAADHSPYEGQNVSVTGTVTATDWRRHGQSGFFLQGPPDRNPRTSDALFVYAPEVVSLAGQRPRRGQQWTVTGLIKEFHGLTEVTDLSSAVRCGEDTPLPAALASPQAGERLEGMRVKLVAPVITDNYQVLRTGTIAVQSQGSSWQLEDGSNRRQLSRLPWGLAQDPTLVANGTPLADLTGVLTYRWNQWVIIPDDPPTPTQLPDWQWPRQPGSALALASWNLRNLFDGADGDFSQSRRAENRQQWHRQRNKTVKTLAALDADLILLQEVEHDRGRDDSTALASLARALNTEAPAGRAYSALQPTYRPGDDAITTAFLYRTDRLATDGRLERVDTEPRPALVQSFVDRQTGRGFTAINVHLKSRNGCPDNCRMSREQALAQLSDAHRRPGRRSDEPVLLGGDFNTLAGEPGWSILNRSGWQRLPITAPTYWYRGRAQQLDHFWWHGTQPPERAQAIPGQAEMPPMPLDHPLWDTGSPWGTSDHNIIHALW